MILNVDQLILWNQKIENILKYYKHYFYYILKNVHCAAPNNPADLPTGLPTQNRGLLATASLDNCVVW